MASVLEYIIMENQNDLKSALSSFGLDELEVIVYLELLQRDWSTVLQLANACSINRTTVYRVIERLTRKGLIEVKVDDKKTYYAGATQKQFEVLVIEQEKKASDLRRKYLDIQTGLTRYLAIKPNETSVRYFRGIQGLKHMEWKMCERERVEILVFDSGNKWFEAMGREFAETVRQEMVEKKITLRELQSNKVAERVTNKAVVSWTDNQTFLINNYLHRTIDNNILTIGQDIHIIGNDAVHIRGYRQGDMVGIETISRDYATTMRQLFNLVWNQAKVVDKFGGENS